MPDPIALISNTKNITYGQLAVSIQTAVEQCRRQGIRQGTKVAIYNETSLDYIILLLALWRIGAVACLLSPRLPPQEIKRQIKKLQCMSWPSGLSPLRYSFIVGNPIPVKKISEHQGLTGLLRSHPPQLIKPATILLTSGSSGEPKAVVHTVGNHYFNALGSNENIPVGKGDCWLLSLPLYHVSGLSILWRCFLGQATIAVMDRDDHLASAIRKFNVTHVSLVTTQLDRLLREQRGILSLKKLKAILLGGGPLPDPLITTAKKLQLPIFLTYGLTEMASQVATSRNSDGKIQILKYRQLKIAEDGEIFVKGKTLFRGYLKNSKITRRLEKGWFATGDLGQIDKKSGLKILGRKDNMFISGGENIYPEEIEKALLNSGLVKQAIVVPVKNSEFGFRPVAFVQWSTQVKAPLLKLRQHLSKSLPAFKIPAQFYEFPRGYFPQGIKIDRHNFKRVLV